MPRIKKTTPGNFQLGSETLPPDVWVPVTDEQLANFSEKFMACIEVEKKPEPKPEQPKSNKRSGRRG